MINAHLKLLSIIERNFKLIIRSKLSALIFLLGPIIILFFVGFAFNTSNLYSLKIATYSDAYSNLSESLITVLQENQYEIIRAQTETECINAVKFYDYQGCIVFPAHMTLNNTAENKVTIHVDNTRLNIANLLASQMVSAVKLESTELSTQMVSDILNVLDNVNKESAKVDADIATAKNYVSKISENAQTSKETIQGIDVNYESIDTTSISTEISKIQEDLNISSSVFSTLSSLINNLIYAYTDATEKLDTTKTVVTDVSTNLDSVKSDASSAQNKLTHAQESLGLITTNISLIEITNVENIVAPIRTSITPLSTKTTYLFYIWPATLVILIMFVGLLLASTTVISEKTSKAYFRNFITQTSSSLFVLGNFLSVFIVLLLQILVMFGISYLFLGAFSLQTYLNSFLILIATAAVFSCIGMCIGYIFNTKQTVVLAALSLGLIFLFFSNVILPIETLSGILRHIVIYNPFVISESLLKMTVLFSASLSTISTKFYILLLMIPVFLILAFLTEKISRARAR